MRSRRPPLFRKRKFEPTVIVTAVRWYCRFCLSLRDVEGLVAARGLSVDHTTSNPIIAMSNVGCVPCRDRGRRQRRGR
jgi:transposase-like protein